MGGSGTVTPKAQAARVEGKGKIVRKDGTIVEFELHGSTHLSEQELRDQLKLEDEE